MNANAFLLALTLHAFGANVADVVPDADRQLKCTELKARIEERFHLLHKNNQLAINQGGVDISDVTSDYVSKGMTFSQAEEFLKACGFDIQRFPPNSNTTRLDKDYVFAYLKSIAGWLPFGIGSEVIISLIPSAPGDYTTIARVRSVINTSAL